ncbi:hypothetical protein [Ferrimonas marina]|uniref:Uncharacterized protein n=1 Tax=Ferrimonas marina TaxID=299255 RepID=A0A1M5S204_9GAMM|nr:hypothetical protein [Ferrimonas marina]SHH32672.1 hypothetical protein SAMN02745129_1845 [Ferrimonas marina]
MNKLSKITIAAVIAASTYSTAAAAAYSDYSCSQYLSDSSSSNAMQYARGQEAWNSATDRLKDDAFYELVGSVWDFDQAYAKALIRISAVFTNESCREDTSATLYDAAQYARATAASAFIDGKIDDLLENMAQHYRVGE